MVHLCVKILSVIQQYLYNNDIMITQNIQWLHCNWYTYIIIYYLKFGIVENGVNLGCVLLSLSKP